MTKPDLAILFWKYSARKLVLGHPALQFSGLCPDHLQKETDHRWLCLFSHVTSEVLPETLADFRGWVLTSLIYYI